MNKIETNHGASFPALSPGPSLNIPRISLPGIFNIQPRFDSEWWYYVGYVDAEFETNGVKEKITFSLHLEILRSGLGELIQIGQGTTGIGWQKNDVSHYISGQGYGIGASESPLSLASLVIPPVNDYSFEAKLVPFLELTGQDQDPLKDLHINFPDQDGFDGWNFQYLADESKGNPIGSPGSVYELSAHGQGYQITGESADTSKAKYKVSLKLIDERGFVMEGQSGYVGPALFPETHYRSANPSYECAQPRLRVSGGSLKINETTCKITAGNLWHDRQMMATPEKSSGEKFARPRGPEDLKRIVTSAAIKKEKLYCGNWMGFVMNNGLSLVVTEFWKPHEKQWISGTKTNHPPTGGFGNIFFNLTGEPLMPEGGRVLQARKSLDQKEGWDYDVNILHPDDPASSPHWKSPISGQTYASAWQIDFSKELVQFGLPEKIFVFTVSESCEIVFPAKLSAYYEGAALVYKDIERKELIGHGFIEQMGYN